MPAKKSSGRSDSAYRRVSLHYALFYGSTFLMNGDLQMLWRAGIAAQIVNACSAGLVAVKPVLNVIALEYGRHTVVDLAHRRIWGHGDYDKGREQHVGLDIDPDVPKAGNVKWFAVGAFDLVGDFNDIYRRKPASKFLFDRPMHRTLSAVQ